ncbi:MAG: L,D-transpeptidase, partial [Pseudomonadota bacterium]
MKTISRRNMLQFGVAAPLILAGCTTTETETSDENFDSAPKRLPFGREPVFPPFEEMYAARKDGGFNIPAVPYEKINRKYLRQVVRDPTGERAGTIVVNTRTHHLY